jgi:Isochorismatase family
VVKLGQGLGAAPILWAKPEVAHEQRHSAIEATGRKKLIFAGISLEVCAAFPAMTAVGKGLDAYVADETSGTFLAEASGSRKWNETS